MRVVLPWKRLALKAERIETLGAGATYMSSSFKTSGYSKIVGYVYSNVASVADGVVIQQCHDDNFAVGVVESKFTMGAGVTLAFSVDVVAQFARMVFINGPTGQEVFRLYCYLKT